jgi:hypothetical protein
MARTKRQVTAPMASCGTVQAGLGTWWQQSTLISSGQFTGDLLDIMSLADLTDDVVVRGLDGSLVVFPFTGVRGLNTFGAPTVIMHFDQQVRSQHANIRGHFTRTRPAASVSSAASVSVLSRCC